MRNNDTEKSLFLIQLKEFASGLKEHIASNDEWTIRGFIDIFKNIHTLSCDTKLISKILELHLFPYFLDFAAANGYKIEPAAHQNWYPDLTFISKDNDKLKFAVDIKTTYRKTLSPHLCKGFTLGSHGQYFSDRKSNKNIQYPYDDYCGHFCLGIIYSRAELNKKEEMRLYKVDDMENIPAVIRSFTFFAEEKWKIASDTQGSGNTANIGSIKNIDDLVNGRGTFCKAGEEIFDDYWINYGKIETVINGVRKKITTLGEYLKYRGLPDTLNNSVSIEDTVNE